MTEEQYKNEQDALNKKFVEAYIANGDSDKHSPSFIDDGVVNFEEWNNIPVKILFFLKEINTGGEPDGMWSLSGVFRNISINHHGGNPVIAQIAKISRTIINCFGKNDTGDFDSTVLDYSFLKYISLINCKKNLGGAQVDWETVEIFTDRYRTLLKEQIDLINPNIIYCCGYSDKAGKSMHKIYESIINEKFEDKLFWSYPAEIYEKNGVYLISAFHPSYIAETGNTLEKLKEVASYIKL